MIDYKLYNVNFSIIDYGKIYLNFELIKIFGNIDETKSNSIKKKTP